MSLKQCVVQYHLQKLHLMISLLKIWEHGLISFEIRALIKMSVAASG